MGSARKKMRPIKFRVWFKAGFENEAGEDVTVIGNIHEKGDKI